jgi:hypothetical protein
MMKVESVDTGDIEDKREAGGGLVGTETESLVMQIIVRRDLLDVCVRVSVMRRVISGSKLTVQ